MLELLAPTGLSVRLDKLLSYDAETGGLIWLPRRLELFPDGRACRIWNTRFANRPAFTTNNGRGYRQGAIFGKKYQAHRVIWALFTGAFPSKELDHIDGDPANNRLANLRAVSSQDNSRNMAMSRRNTSGVVGVYWFGRTSKWMAAIRIDNKQKHLGYFANFEDAVVARKAAERVHGFHTNHGRAPK